MPIVQDGKIIDKGFLKNEDELQAHFIDTTFKDIDGNIVVQ